MSAPERRSMESAGLIVAVALLLLAPVAVYVATTGGGDRPGMREEPPAPPPAAEKPVPRARTVKDSELDREERRTIRQPVQRLARIEPAPPVKRPRKVFPTPEAIKVGTKKSQLLANFGQPNMITTAVDEGRATETFVYLQPDVEMGTVVHLRSGVVVGAGSTAY